MIKNKSQELYDEIKRLYESGVKSQDILGIGNSDIWNVKNQNFIYTENKNKSIEATQEIVDRIKFLKEVEKKNIAYIANELNCSGKFIKKNTIDRNYTVVVRKFKTKIYPTDEQTAAILKMHEETGKMEGFIYRRLNIGRCAWNLKNLRPYNAKLNHIDGSRKTRHKTDAYVAYMEDWNKNNK